MMPDRPVPPLELATRPDRDIAAAILVTEDGRYLLQLRDDIPQIHLPGYWSLFGGSLEPGEDAEAALKRELAEELGIAIASCAALCSSVQGFAHSGQVWRLTFFVVPILAAAVDGMVQTEGAGRGLFTLAEAAALERVAPWDLAALMIHGRADSLWRGGQAAPRLAPR